jgi:hypothetical protein
MSLATPGRKCTARQTSNYQGDELVAPFSEYLRAVAMSSEARAKRADAARHSTAAARSSLSAPRMRILSASSGNGRCNAFASSHGARIQTSRSSSVVRDYGHGLWIGSTTTFDPPGTSLSCSSDIGASLNIV